MSGKCLDPSLYQTLGYSPADWMPSTGGEFNSIPSVFSDRTPNAELEADGYTGPTYWKLPPFGYPTAQQTEPYVLDPRTYDKTVFNSKVSLFATDGGATEASFAEPSAAAVSSGSVHMSSNPSFDFRVRHRDESSGTIDIDLEVPISVSREYLAEPGSGSDRDSIETNLYYSWNAERAWSRYARTARTPSGELRLQPIAEDEAPPALREYEYTESLRGRTDYEPHERFASASFDATCFECVDAARCGGLKVAAPPPLSLPMPQGVSSRCGRWLSRYKV